MEIVSFRTPGLGDQTYLLLHEGQGVLVDPQRDIDRFLNEAAERDVDLRFVLETHLHNDYLSGAEQAARRTGAELVLPAAAAPAYRHTPAFHLEDIRGGAGLSLRPLHTPGHTPEHTSYLVLIGGEPVAVFSGGSLLVSSAGRPDLLGPERARTLARLQHGSLRRLAELPGDVELLPTHGEGSFCSTTKAGSYTSTISKEKTGNPLLAIADAEEFADRLLAEPMPIPAFYEHMGQANTLGVPPMPNGPVPELTPEQFGELQQAGGGAAGKTRLVDVRPRARQAQGFVPGSIGIELADDFGSWAGWLLPRHTPIVLIAEPEQDVSGALTQLARIGMDEVRGVVRDLGEAATARFELADLPAFADRLPGAQVLDVRMPSEQRDRPLPGAIERFLPDLLSDSADRDMRAELDPDRPVLIACGSGRRASIAATILAHQGYEAVVLDGAGAGDAADEVRARART